MERRANWYCVPTIRSHNSGIVSPQFRIERDSFTGVTRGHGMGRGGDVPLGKQILRKNAEING
jgi:hypothetical protein